MNKHQKNKRTHNKKIKLNKQDDNEKIQHQSQNHEFVHDKVCFTFCVDAISSLNT